MGTRRSYLVTIQFVHHNDEQAPEVPLEVQISEPFIQSMEKDGIDNLVLEADVFHQALEEKSIVASHTDSPFTSQK